ncbi:universal stress protein [Pedobacter immunditicola]|uniref:universal stress protein n=1 Tax=Pedobacter immunditicola TaxID=3133440 RepID=UPI0030A6FDB4
MKTLLVATDFSSNSASAIRFAIQLASQNNFALTFFHSCHIQRPTAWKDSVYATFEQNELSKQEQSLQEFVKSSYTGSAPMPEHFDYRIHNGTETDLNIMEFAAKNKYDYICIGRTGHGKSIKLFGSITSHLITKSQVPVIAVPDNYRETKIEKVTYASDMNNIDKELKLVLEFSQSINAELEVLHFKTPGDELIKSTAPDFPGKFHVENLNYEKTLIENIDGVIKQSDTSMLIMFTQQKRTFFEKLFVSSISAEYASIIDIPILVFKKPQ